MNPADTAWLDEFDEDVDEAVCGETIHIIDINGRHWVTTCMEPDKAHESPHVGPITWWSA